MQFWDIIIAFFFNISTNKRIGVWDHDLIEKNLLQLEENWGGNYLYQFVKNLLNLIRQQKKKLGGLINGKLPELDKKIMRKIDHLLLYVFTSRKSKTSKSKPKKRNGKPDTN